eukprot:Pgem_evm1s13345
MSVMVNEKDKLPIILKSIKMANTIVSFSPALKNRKSSLTGAKVIGPGLDSKCVFIPQAVSEFIDIEFFSCNNGSVKPEL